MKVFELIIFVLFAAFSVLIIYFYIKHYVYIINKEKTMLYHFYLGRYILENITEKEPYADGICNLTPKFFTIFNKTWPVFIEIAYLNGTPINKTGYYSPDNYFEFRRVCYYNGKLYLIIVRS